MTAGPREAHATVTHPQRRCAPPHRALHRGPRATALALVALLACLSCAGPAAERGALARDLLTDLRDDGSLVEGALSGDPATRELAVAALANLPPVEATGLLLNRAEIERDPAVLTGFCYLFGRWRLAAALPLLETLSADGRAAVRAAALDALGRYGDDAFTPRLVLGLEDPDRLVRRAACEALERVDAARSDHRRTASEATLLTRDTALAEAALRDPDPGVRWRAVWALGRVRPRPGQATVLRRALADDEPLARLFALRGLSREPGIDAAPLAAALDDRDPRVVVAAAAALARVAPLVAAERRLGHPDPTVRRLAAEGLRNPDSPVPPAVLAALVRLSREDPSAAVAREAAAALAVRDGPRGDAAREQLMGSANARDRERLARLLADGEIVDEPVLQALLGDPVPVVRAAAVAALGRDDPLRRRAELLAALASDDVAVRGSAAEACAPTLASGRAPPWLVSAVADSLSELDDPAMAEARVALAEALGLPALDPAPPAVAPEGELLARLQAEREAALADRHVFVELVTDRGRLVLELDRLLAPRHVASLLELAEAGFYDGLDIHRVVPNFVVQGLDPRGDGWGTGGRRLPDEFRNVPVDTGTVGMPRTGARHTGGCQLFLTLAPAPHLSGEYTVLGRVSEGLELLPELQIGDTVERVRRLPER